MKKNLKKVKKNGKYGSSQSVNDEGITTKCIEDVYYNLSVTSPIDKWRFVFTTEYDANGNGHSIKPDGGFLFLVSEDDDSKRYLVLAGEDKSQKTGGNAFERWAHQFLTFRNTISKGMDILPYVTFCRGEAYNRTNILERIGNIFPFEWTKDSKKSILKDDNWNELYISDDNNPFTENEKYTILLEVAKESLEYIKKNMIL